MQTCKICGHDKPPCEFYTSSKSVCRVCRLLEEKVKREAKAAKAVHRIEYVQGDLPIRNSNSTGSYEGKELAPFSGREGANDAIALPSRMGSRLHYRDGRVERLP